MIFILTTLAWFSLLAGGIGLIVVSEPWWNRTPQPVARPVALDSRRRRRPARPLDTSEPCLDCAA